MKHRSQTLSTTGLSAVTNQWGVVDFLGPQALTDHQQKLREPKLEYQPPHAWFWESVANVWRHQTTVIDVLAVLNALRAAFPPKVIFDL